MKNKHIFLFFVGVMTALRMSGAAEEISTKHIAASIKSLLSESYEDGRRAVIYIPTGLKPVKEELDKVWNDITTSGSSFIDQKEQREAAQNVLWKAAQFIENTEPEDEGKAGELVKIQRMLDEGVFSFREKPRAKKVANEQINRLSNFCVALRAYLEGIYPEESHHIDYYVPGVKISLGDCVWDPRDGGLPMCSPATEESGDEARRLGELDSYKAMMARVRAGSSKHSRKSRVPAASSPSSTGWSQYLPRYFGGK